MRMSGTEARHLVAPWIRDHRPVWCMFGSPAFHDARSGVLWAVDAHFLTIRQLDGERSVDLHVPFEDVAIEFYEPAQAPGGIRPDQPLECYDGALCLQEPQISEAGAAIELSWAVWITNPRWEREAAAGG
jgi:hypothetical protein